MALPDNLHEGLLPSEAEFLATSATEIGIVPLMRIDRVRVLGGVYGPLRPPQQARVPLWMALSLKKRKRCSIVCPDWLAIDNLRELHRAETTTEAFAPLPLHYMAISKVLLESAKEDIPHSDEVRAVLKSIREARQSKVMEGIKNVNTEHLAINDISAGEVTELRPFLGTAFKHLLIMQRSNVNDEQGHGMESAGSYTQGAASQSADRTFTWKYGSPEQKRRQQPIPSSTYTTRGYGHSQARDDHMRTESSEWRQESAGAEQAQSARGRANARDESQNNMDLF